ncbi:Stk1 family PASTA domain-containing Ser/Thr kinase [Pediococcus claussenii]|uniref:non-specific serine/threonine protein kinase n=1 Tax=Pediococcus claussenii (strain ATCC BAA-344 / DSM 14800 / JCM 18046 / KCTC 3811 / LMG 21948 / P06) TaxID=701521 RepID=G8PDI1_PEDCP|nr:Stk1 family PASTA domain-containing Ser/Thr kinase [Pediococcus claussenii]AEV95316.1 phosphotransferase enzyme family protein [Pediococcus claussenii ATCC BAA-344]ANZ68849.1 protein kinase [Pediococcus claussenii]ANZ70665.1 protein kinase [Pediococcus claussenii]KRN19502.1 hypothetical protein IV79_GL001219 [Pediococcus claussenii]
MTPNQTLNGRYKVIRSLGEGGMANVYLAHDLILDRDVAVKLIRIDMQDDESALRRFQREALATTELVHPNIVGVYDIGEDHGLNYLVMEYVDGENLKQYIHDNFPLDFKQIIKIMKQILNGVETAHLHGIIHRDLKPQNILIDKNGNAKITDFGIALANEDSSFTKTNSVIGSVQYLSPEQVRGHVATQQSDIYSLGIILFEMLTGKVPFEGESAVSIAIKHYQDQVPFVRSYDDRIPQPLENVVLKATAKNQMDRYSNIQEMSEDLDSTLNPERASEDRFVAGEQNEETIVLDQAEIDQKLNTFTPESGDAKIRYSTNNKVNYPKNVPQKESHRPKHRHPIRRRALFTFLVMVAFIGSILIAFKLSSPRMVNVPGLTGMTQNAATVKLSKSQLGIGKVTKSASNKINYGSVIATLPTAGKSVQQGIKVNLEVSIGPNSFDTDNYVGGDFSSTKKQLEKKGFTIKEHQIETTKFDNGRIISQSVVAGQVVVPRVTTITFTTAR